MTAGLNGNERDLVGFSNPLEIVFVGIVSGLHHKRGFGLCGALRGRKGAAVTVPWSGRKRGVGVFETRYLKYGLFRSGDSLFMKIENMKHGSKIKKASGKAPAFPDLDARNYSRYRVPNLERVLLILETLAQTPQGLTFMELIIALKLPKAGGFRIITTLLHHGYVRRDPVTSRLSLSRKILTLGNSTICQYNIFEQALPIMRRLRDVTGETVQLDSHIGAEGVVLDQVPAIHEIRIVVDPGTRFSLHGSAPGKAILAFLPEPERESILAAMPMTKYSSATITEMPLFREELSCVRQRGYGTDQAEGMVAGLHCISAPVLDQSGYPVAALTVTAPAMRLPAQAFPEMAIKLVAHASELSQRLGYRLLESGLSRTA